MGRHKLPYKMKKPNQHHRYWRYVLSSDPHQSEISTRTRVKYEAERIAKDAYQDSLLRHEARPLFKDYVTHFFTSKCKLTARRSATNRDISQSMLNVKRGQLDNYLLPEFGHLRLDEIHPVAFEDWRLGLDLANSTKNGITIVMKQILNEAVRDGLLAANPLHQVESLAKIQKKPRDLLSVEELQKLFPAERKKALAVWKTQKYHTLMFLLVSSGMRSGEVRALRWTDVVWDDSGLLITKAMKNSGDVGTVKENREKFVRVPARTIELLRQWRTVSKAPGENDVVFYGKTTDRPVDRGTILENFRAGLERAGITGAKNLVPHSLRHTFNSYMLGALPSDLVRRFTGHSSEQMSRHYYHPLLRRELKATEEYQAKIDAVWGVSDSEGN